MLTVFDLSLLVSICPCVLVQDTRGCGSPPAWQWRTRSPPTSATETAAGFLMKCGGSWTPRVTRGDSLTPATFSALHWYCPWSDLVTEPMTRLPPSSLVPGLSVRDSRRPSFIQLVLGGGKPFGALQEITTVEPTATSTSDGRPWNSLSISEVASLDCLSEDCLDHFRISSLS